jgi:hypothetical protein
MSNATCAGCEEPIATGEPFMLWGTEVFHKDRACLRLVRQSVGTRQKLAIAKLKQEQLEIDKRAHARDVKLHELEAEVVTQRENLRVEKQAKERAMALADDLSKRNEQIAERNIAARQHRVRAAELEKQLADAKAEITKLKNEALRRATDDLPVAKKDDTRDATEIRFSLLELDKS